MQAETEAKKREQKAQREAELKAEADQKKLRANQAAAHKLTVSIDLGCMHVSIGLSQVASSVLRCLFRAHNASLVALRPYV